MPPGSYSLRGGQSPALRKPHRRGNSLASTSLNLRKHSPPSGRSDLRADRARSSGSPSLRGNTALPSGSPSLRGDIALPSGSPSLRGDTAPPQGAPVCGETQLCPQAALFEQRHSPALREPQSEGRQPSLKEPEFERKHSLV